VRETNSAVSFARGIVQQNLVGRLCPDCGEFNGSRTVKYELIAATATILLQFEFAHGKVMFEEILFATQHDVNEMSQMVQ
jgi:hypothetical protein